MRLFLPTIRMEGRVIIQKENSLMFSPNLESLNGPLSHRKNSKFLSRAKKNIDQVEFCLSSLILHPKTHNFISNYHPISPIPGTIILILLPGPSFSLLDNIQQFFRAYVIFPLCPPEPFITCITVFNAASNHLFTPLSVLVCKFLEVRG